jgi:hypothetical protein
MMFVLYLACSGASAWVAARRMGSPQLSWTGWFIPFAALWALLEILPIQAASALGALGACPREGFAPLVIAQAALLIVVLWLVPRRAPLFAETPQPGRCLWGLRVAGLLALASYGLGLACRLFGFPDSWDAVAYHLPKATLWLQAGLPPLREVYSWQMALPGNAEMAMMPWLGAGWHSLSAAPNALAAVTLCAAVYELSLSLSGRREAALASTVVAASIPIVRSQAFDPYVDLFGTAYLLGGVAVFVRWTQTGRKGWYLPLLSKTVPPGSSEH